jgi:predicted glycoside hydrolase/deacetylase ChbG (UPF0249 family)
MKRITLCADDYGMHPVVSEAILELADKRRIQATSCLVTSPGWSQCSQKLSAIQGKVDIGLHLNFTEGCGLSAAYMDGLPSLGKMLLTSHLRLLDKNTLIEEVTAQYQTFVDTTGQEPDFIDGHQHVHHLPMVRDALMAVIRRYKPAKSFWVRSVIPMIKKGGNLKSHIIEASGGKPFLYDLINHSINTNTSFAGIYSLEPDQPYRELMKVWLEKSYDRGLIMCHPGKTSARNQLDHSDARQAEFDYLSGDEFLDDCKTFDIQLSTL